MTQGQIAKDSSSTKTEENLIFTTTLTNSTERSYHLCLTAVFQKQLIF